MPTRTPRQFQSDRGRMRAAGVVWLVASVALAFHVLQLPARAQPGTTAPATTPAPTAETTTAPSITPAEAMVDLIDDDPQKRVAAAVKIIEIGSDEAFALLTRVLNQKNSEDAKAAICEAIIKTGSKAQPFVEPLLRIAESSNGSLGALALQSLSHFDDAEVAGKVNAIKTRREHALLLEAVREMDRKLYDLTPENEKSAYLENLLNRPLAVRRVTGLEIVHRDLSIRKPQDTLLQKVRSLLSDENPAVVRAAVVVLRDLRQKSDAALLRDVLKTQGNPDVRETIYHALGFLNDPDSIAVCAEGLHASNEKVAALAASSLGSLASHNPGPGEELRRVAIQALLSRYEKPMTDPLLRSNVVEAMAKIAAPEFAPVFVKSLDPSTETLPAVRQFAVRGLAALQSAEHLGAILQAMATDPDVRVREVAAEAVGKIGRSLEVLTPLRQRLGDSSEAVSKAAWSAYLAVIDRLKPEQRMEAVESWDSADPATLDRRVELLNQLAKSADVDGPQRALLNEEAGDGLVTLKRSIEAGGAYSRALEATPAGDQENHRERLAAKMLDAYLSAQDASRALTEAAKFKSEKLRELAAGKFHAYASGLSADARRAFLEQLAAKIPGQFGGPWPDKFAALMPRPSTQPATSTAPAT